MRQAMPDQPNRRAPFSPDLFKPTRIASRDQPVRSKRGKGLLTSTNNCGDYGNDDGKHALFLMSGMRKFSIFFGRLYLFVRVPAAQNSKHDLRDTRWRGQDQGLLRPVAVQQASLTPQLHSRITEVLDDEIADCRRKSPKHRVIKV